MKLFPPIRPYRHGYLNVSDNHQLYYELCGNPKGKPVLFVHGGPGQGCSPNSRRFFNPKKFNVILFDQRGAGRSKPFGSTKANTTQKLIADMRSLLKFLNVKKVFLFGGSWGSTLSLAYAIKHPKTVTGMLLRGVFLDRKWDIDFTFGGGAEAFFPESWQRFIEKVPKPSRKDGRSIASFYIKKMLSRDNNTAKKYAYEWARYELSMLKIAMPDKELKAVLKEYNFRSLAILEAHYLRNHCFLTENYILRHAKVIKHISLNIVQGRYDVICPPVQAYLLHKALPKSKLYVVAAGHGSSEPEIQKKLLELMNRKK
jgi:proline iminopeptidase